MNVVKPTRVPIWEKTKREKRKNRLIRLGVLFVVLVIASNLIIKLPSWYRELNTPFPALPTKTGDVKKLNTAFRTNILLISYERNRLVDVAILSYEPVDKRITALFFNLSKYKKLRLQTNKAFRNGGIERLESFISLGLAVPLDRYLAFEDSDLKFTSEKVMRTTKQIGSWTVVFRLFSAKRDLNDVLKTNLTTGELFGLIWQLRGAKYEDKDNYPLSNADINNLQTEEISSLTSSLFFDRKILDEAAAVTVKNSSGVPGVGSVLASYLSNLGATVVVVESSEELVDESTMFIKNKGPDIESRLRSIFSFKTKKMGTEEELSGDILIEVGKEGAKELTLP